MKNEQFYQKYTTEELKEILTELQILEVDVGIGVLDDIHIICAILNEREDGQQ